MPVGDRTLTRLNPGEGGDGMDEVITRVAGEDLKAPVVVPAYVDGAAAFLVDPYPAQRFDIGESTIYVGYAPRGTLDSAAAWKIKRVDLAAGVPTATRWTAPTATWDARASESYT